MVGRVTSRSRKIRNEVRVRQARMGNSTSHYQWLTSWEGLIMVQWEVQQQPQLY